MANYTIKINVDIADTSSREGLKDIKSELISSMDDVQMIAGILLQVYQAQAGNFVKEHTHDCRERLAHIAILKAVDEANLIEDVIELKNNG